MKVRVIKAFIDKQTNTVRKVNEVFDCDKARLNEIQKAGSFVEPVPFEKVKKEAEKEG